MWLDTMILECMLVLVSSMNKRTFPYLSQSTYLYRSTQPYNLDKYSPRVGDGLPLTGVIYVSSDLVT